MPLVLWTAVLLAVVAASFAARSRSEAVIARNLEARAAAEAVADGGVNAAIARLLAGDAPPPKRWRFEIGSGVALVTAIDEASKLDINTAELDLLGRLFEHRLDGVAADRAMTLLRRARRLEQRFTSVASFVAAAGLDVPQAARVAPRLTVFTSEFGVAPDLLSADVRAALFPPATVEDEEGVVTAGAEQGVVWTLISEGRSGEAARFRRLATVMLARGSVRPVTVLRWERFLEESAELRPDP